MRYPVVFSVPPAALQGFKQAYPKNTPFFFFPFWRDFATFDTRSACCGAFEEEIHFVRRSRHEALWHKACHRVPASFLSCLEHRSEVTGRTSSRLLQSLLFSMRSPFPVPDHPVTIGPWMRRQTAARTFGHALLSWSARPAAYSHASVPAARRRQKHL